MDEPSDRALFSSRSTGLSCSLNRNISATHGGWGVTSGGHPLAQRRDTGEIQIIPVRPQLGIFESEKNVFYITTLFKNGPGPRGIHLHPFSAQTEPRRPISSQILTKLSTVYFDKDQIFWTSDDLDLIFWISDDFDKPKKMRNVRTIIFHPFSRRDLCHVSENEGFRCAKKIFVSA